MATTGTITSSGIGSGLDVNGIIAKLIAVDKQPLLALAKQQAGYQAKISAYGALQGALSAFQTTLAGLTSPVTFQKLSATVTDPTILTASAATTAVPGSYTVNVSQLAQAQSLYTAAQTSLSAPIGSGATTTVQFQFGTIAGGTLTGGIYTGASFTANSSLASGTVTISSSNNTLAGIRDAINAANVGVSATIVNDGSATPYRLVVTSNHSGAAGALKISVTGDAAIGGLLGYDPAATQNLTQSQVAQDANLTINGLAVSSASNSVSGPLQGVTLNLNKVGSTSVAVARDTASAQNAVQNFVKAYNDTSTTLASLTSYDPTTKQAGLLLGDSTVQRIQHSLRGLLNTTVTGGAYSTLSQIGVSFQKDGTLAIDAVKLQAALAQGSADVATLFATTGKTGDSLVSYLGSTTFTQAGNYALNVTALATHGGATGSTALGPTTTLTTSNNGVSILLDGVSTAVSLTPGSYTAAQLATLLQSAINGATGVTAAGLGVAVTQSAGILTVNSNSYGSTSTVGLSGSAIATLFGTPTSAAGINVAGSIGGIAATGSGQSLVGASGAAAGLRVSVNGGATGSRGSVTFTRGYADQLNTLVGDFLSSSGLIASRTGGLQKSITGLDVKRGRLNTQISAAEARYRTQFTQLDVTLSSLNSTMSYLQQQLASLNASLK